jgi:hypothetical protein
MNRVYKIYVFKEHKIVIKWKQNLTLKALISLICMMMHNST